MNGDGTARAGTATRDAVVPIRLPAAGAQRPGAIGGRRQQRKTETRERLLDAASELFASRGFAETTYDDIAAAAGVARQTVFNYFPRKEDFVLAWGARRREEVAEALVGSALAEGRAVARLALMMRVLANSYERAPAAGRVYTIAWVKWGGPVLEEPILAAQFADVIADGQRSGEIRADVSAETAGQLIRAAYFDALWRWAAPSRREDAPSLFAELLARLELLLTGWCVEARREGIKQSLGLAQAIERAAMPSSATDGATTSEDNTMTHADTPQARVAIVTGGSRGIGRSVVRRLADDGYHIVIGYGSNQDEAAAAVAEAASLGAKAIAVAADIGDENAAASLFDQAEQAYGGIDVVVNAAGVMSLAPLADFDLAVLDRMFHTNIRGTFVVDQQAARRVRAGGTIINFSSSVLGRVLPTYTGYAASKAAVEAMTFILAHELRGRDVTVNAVAPGPTATEMFLEGKDEELLTRLANAVPLERLGVPDDIAQVVAFLASTPGHWINGQTVRVNGGII